MNSSAIRIIFRRLYYTIVCCCLIIASSCGRPPGDDVLLEAWQHCEALEYEAAFPLIRAYLLAHPRNAVAHYLLGKCYQQREKPALTLAKGQFDMARHFFDSDGDISILAAIMTPAEFQAMLHCDTALVLLRTVIEAEETGMPQTASIPVLRAARDHARKAMYFSPNSFFISDLAQTLDNMLDMMAPPEEPESHPSPLPQPGRWMT